MKWFRRLLLEVWGIVPVAAVVGFLGPFGSYLSGDFLIRVGRWWGLLMMAYIVMRPAIELWRWIARLTRLPQGSLVFWGMVLSSFPLALAWRLAGREEVRMLGGYTGLLPFTLLCSLLIIAVVWWAERADLHLQRYYDGSQWSGDRWQATKDGVAPASTPGLQQYANRPRLYARLNPQFEGDILALESEDHYVRVHGTGRSELILIRLRDAIAEMDGVPGEQTHRSWWVARNAVSEIAGAGRNRHLVLQNGAKAMVARDSIERLQRSGFLTV